MEAAIGAKRTNLEWDLNDWQWDGELFKATPLNSGIQAQKRVISVIDVENDVEVGLGLNIGGGESVVRKGGSSSSSRPICQVEGCGADLSGVKDYHRRHKVCEMHAKASTAVVGNSVQRFCQQCSRFHLLQEFDEGKRSCRRRLAGHNKRRRKTQHDVPNNGNPLIDEHTSSYLLITLLRVLANLHSDNSQQSKDQDLLSSLLGSLANLAGNFDPNNLSRLLQPAQDPEQHPTAPETSNVPANTSASGDIPVVEPSRLVCLASTKTSNSNLQVAAVNQHDLSVVGAQTTSEMPSTVINTSPETTRKRVRVKDFDLNSTYCDMQVCGDDLDKTTTPCLGGGNYPNYPSWLVHHSHQLSPPQASGNSDSASAHSLSSSSGDAKFRTDRIVFKLFGKDPGDLPILLRGQMIDWLSHSPTDIESYIKPGCVVLTTYLRISEAAWLELYNNFVSCLSRLLHNSDDDFWTSGWIFAKFHHHVALAYNGQFLFDNSLSLRYPIDNSILFVTPIAVTHSSRTKFTVKGFNLSEPTVRLLCSFDGKYLTQEQVPIDESGLDADDDNHLRCVSVSCSLPSGSGRGFFEVEDQGISNGFFPFIVAEEEVCSEVCMLEDAIDLKSFDKQLNEERDAYKVRNNAVEFIHEFGWLLRRNNRKATFQEMSPPNTYELTRFKWLLDFSMNKEWAAVVRKLLDILFNGIVDVGNQSLIEIALSVNLLHTAVRRNSRVMVELLLNYVPNQTKKETDLPNILFRPDMVGPSGITPLHIAASSSSAESVLDALTNDPGQFGIKAWKNARDGSGYTPEDYARVRGHDSYILLVQNKLNKQEKNAQVVFNIPSDGANKIAYETKLNKLGFDIESRMKRQDCKRCTQQLAYRNPVSRIFVYRPAMLSMMAVAAVCVCVGLLLKTPPRVYYVFPSFRWELLEYGPM